MTLVGEQIQASPGGWSGNPTSYAYQWQRSDDGVTGWADIAGETRSDYITEVVDLDKYLRCAVVAANAGGESTVVYSDSVPIGQRIMYIPILRAA